MKLGRTYLALGQPDRALKAVAGLQALQPELPWPHLIAGQALLEKGQAKEAIVALERSLGTNPFDPERALRAGRGLPEAARRCDDTFTGAEDPGREALPRAAHPVGRRPARRPQHMRQGPAGESPARWNLITAR